MADARWTLDHDIDAYLATMKLPPADYMQELAAKRAPIEAGAPQVGDPAPVFTAKCLITDGMPAGEQVSLADFKGKRLALLFGNYTCPVYRGQIKRFNEIYTELQDELSFLLVYISEAHPEDGWQVEINHTQHVVYDQPTEIDERVAIAKTCIQQHDIRMPVVLDDMDNTVNNLYSGSPERLYLIDEEGIVQHRSVPGPFKMDAIEAWYQALMA
ncbi:MAG: redoxin domain-containing protein [Gammaproteobacteria bacterium]|jgi:type I thyroxine 5'-deiodinase|nr:redoxin domain-containing protein [Gammaproteobacteria bacterium]MDP6616099.1 redoxin domain-containing protein [Gammaproteobacteria bacterium]MDP6696061.1 redoxin domain-containing protein [Gammaproteobacteria bacterium]